MKPEIPHAVIQLPRSETDYVRGIFSEIVPEINVPTGDWSAWLPSKEPQEFKFDTDECTQLSGINVVETQLNWLKAQGKMLPEAIKWFTDNGYFDNNGYFALSERFSGVLSGTTINGNSPWMFWKTVAKYGILPRKDLNYTQAWSQQFLTQEAMCNDYYDPSYVTEAMKAKAKQSLQWLQFQYEWIGGEFDSATPLGQMKDAIKQAPLHIAVPVCSSDLWNNPPVPACGVLRTDHAVTCYRINEPDNSYAIFDHYNPYTKTLSGGYRVPQVILGVVKTTPVPPPELATDGQNTSLTPAESNYFQALVKWISGLIARLFP